MNNNNIFANDVIQGFLIREKRLVALPIVVEGAPNTSERQVAALLTEIAQFGFTFDGELTRAVRRLDIAALGKFRKAVIENLKQAVGAHVQYRPLFRSFPKDIPDDFEYLVRKFFGYVETAYGMTAEGYKVLSCGHIVNRHLFDIDQFGACPVCQRAAPELDAEKTDFVPLSEITKLKVIGLATYDDILTTFVNAAQSRTSLSQSYKDFMVEVIALEKDAVSQRLPAVLPFKENMALVVAMLLKGGVSHSALAPYVKTTTDMLRIVVALSGGDISLAETCRFKLSMSQRRFVMRTLEKLPQSKEQMLADMVGYVERWVRLGEVLHVRQQTEKLPKVAECFRILRNDPDSVVTYNAAVGHLFDQYHLSSPDGAKLLELLSERPGEFARKLDALLQRGGVEESDVLERFEAAVPYVSTTTLLTLLTHFRTRGEKAPFRAFMPKGSVAKMWVVNQDKRHTLGVAVRSNVIEVVRNELVARFKKLESLGKVFIDETLDGILVPTAQRSASTGLVSVPRGSRMKYDESKGFLRMFVYWMETPETGTIDVDLSCGLYSEDWEMLSQMSWTSMHSFGRSTHSGDVRSAPAPKGAAEFIDLDLHAAKHSGARYALMNVFSYTGQDFSEFPAFAGVMERDEPQKGGHFDARTVANKFDITTPTKAVAPLAVDLVTGEVLWLDMALKGGRYGMIETKSDKMVAMAKAIDAMKLSRVSLYDLFELHTAARGQLVQTREEADVVLDMEQLKNMDDIIANWL